MFNLLRRRVRRKHNNNKNKYNIDAATADGVAVGVVVQSSNDDNVPKYCYTNDESGEHYHQISEKNDEQQPTAVVASANTGASITGKTSKTTRNGKNNVREEEEQVQDIADYLYVNNGGKTAKKNNAINAGKFYFENARDKRSYFKKVKNDEQQQQQQGQEWKTNDKQVHLAQRTDNFSNISTFELKQEEEEEEESTDDNNYLEKVDTQYEQRQEEEAATSAANCSKKVEDVSYDHLACGFSHNELAERQRCVLTIGEYDDILLNRTNRPTTTITTTTSEIEENQLNNIDNAFKIKNNSENQQEFNVENVHNINNYKFNRGATTTTTTPTSANEEQISTINNEVKYRNLDKTSRNEAKRQSRLSFTLAGISFGRKKEVDDRVKNDQDNDNNAKNNYKKNLSAQVDNVLEVVVAEPAVNNQKTKINESFDRQKKIKLNPFQKSREYLNNLFMARGRQQNRQQRHQQQQQQQLQVSKQQQQNGNKNDTSIKKMTSSCKNVNSNATALHLNITDSTNSYQIPLSKNSITINTISNTNQKEVSAHKNRERELSRSNSATYARTHSLSPQLSKKRSRSVTFSDVDHIIENDGRDLWLNRNNVAVDQFSRTGNIERGVSKLSSNTANENLTQENNNYHTGDTHGVVRENEAGYPTTTRTASAFEHTNNHLIRTSSHTRNSEEITKYKGESTTADLYNKLNQIDNNKSSSPSTSTSTSTCPTPTPSYKMGQTNAKSETPTRDFRESSVSSTTSERDRVKKVSFANLPETSSSPININLPTITVADFSEALNSATTTSTPTPTLSDQEVFYDFDINDRINNNNNTMTVDNDIEHDANFYIGAAAHQLNNSNNNKWQMPNSVFLSQSQMRHNYVKLEDVREEDENEANNEEDDDDDQSEEEDDDDDESDYDNENKKRPRHLDNELYNSSERSPLKSSDTTLSGSPSDSGIGTDSQPATPSNVKSRHSPTTYFPTTARNETENIQQLKQQIKQQYGFMSFVRDGNSTDCDEIPLNCDDIDLDLADDDSTNERLVCIESISLPDVVVESTAATSSSTTLSSASSTTSSEHIINISSGASSNSMGNVHFIPIHIEGASNAGSNNGAAKRRSSDDSVIGNGTIEITEDASVMNGYVKDNRQTDKLK